VETVACHTDRIHHDIKGVDVATALLRTASGVAVALELAYAGLREVDRFPETFVTVEGEGGTIALGPGCEIRVTRSSGTESRRAVPPRYAWADPDYDLVHASIVPCARDLLGALRGGKPAETSAEDNLKTVRLVAACAESARSGQTVRVSS
jgi:predicted dehydrogenase